MNWKDHIEVNPAVLIGKPIIKGTRISVELILDRMADGWTMEDVLTSYPRISREDVLAAMSDDELNEIIERIGRNYVVMNKAGTSVMKNPGTGLPFYTPIKLRAEQVAKEVDGVVILFDEAFKKLSNLK